MKKIYFLAIFSFVANASLISQSINSESCGNVLVLSDQYYSQSNLTTTEICYSHDEAGNVISARNCDEEDPEERDPSVLFITETLLNGDSLISKNELFEAVMTAEGNLVLINKVKGCTKWQSGTSGSNNNLSFNSDGNLVIPGWSSQTSNLGGVKLVMQDDGNLVMYDAHERAVWATGTPEPVWDNRPNTDHVLYVNESLFEEDYLISNNKKYKLYFQSDGNVVIYGATDDCSTKILWNTGTVGDANRFTLQNDGNLVLYKPNGIEWQSNSAGNVAQRLELLNNGNLVIYRQDGSILWQSGSIDPNAPVNEMIGIKFSNDLPPSVVTLFPNPARNVVYVTSNQAIGKVILFDIYGIELLTQQTSGIPNEIIQIDVSTINSGLYLLVTQKPSGELLETKRVYINID